MKKARRSFPRPFTNSITERNCCNVKPWIFRRTCTDTGKWTNICGSAALRAYPSIPIIRKNPRSMTSAKCLSMSAAKHFEGLAACMPVQRDGRRQLKSGLNPFISVLIVAPRSCCFSGIVATTYDSQAIKEYSFLKYPIR